MSEDKGSDVMSRRKGEITKAAIDRGWPYQVSLDADTVRRRFAEIEAVTQQFSRAPRGHAYRRNDRDYVVYCFADPHHAEQFATLFDGQEMTPDSRPRW